jgi:hypothetical protein
MATKSQLDQVLSATSRIESSLKTGQIFDGLEIVRDQIRDLKNQNQQIRNELLELQKTVLQQSTAGAAD